MRHPDGFYRYRINEEIFAFPDEKPQYQNSVILPTDPEFAERWAVEPLRQLRIQRNNLLAQTDWRMTTDYPYNDQADWATYRTALRNLPATANPTLDEQGNLIVDWPTPPSNV